MLQSWIENLIEKVDFMEVILIVCAVILSVWLIKKIKNRLS